MATPRKIQDFFPGKVFINCQNRVSSGQGKVREIRYQTKVRELSGNFVMGQGKLKMLGKVWEKSGNFERFMAMVVSWVIWNILDNILIHCWWSCWHQWLRCQAPMIHWIFHWCQISWYTIFPVTLHENYSLHMKLKGFGTPCLQRCFIVAIIRAIILFLFPAGA